MEMGSVHHWNIYASGPCEYYVSQTTGKRLCFRVNEIMSVNMTRMGTAIVKTVYGYSYQVTSPEPEYKA